MAAVRNPKLRAFTLIELLVAVAVFSLVAVSSSEIFVQSLRNQRRLLAQGEVLSQTSYLMEYVSRAIRMARKDVNGNCIGAKLNYQKTASGVKFQNYQGVCQEFYLDGSQLKEDKNGVISPLTSASLQVLSFNVGLDDSWDQNDNLQPLVSFSLEIRGREQSKIKIQTAVSQRNLDVEL